ncbi:DUF11 domain-containing protein, partial [candidate division KSB3 bacterium]|nr:DUF11 domain-containing protein [candidate division KSB3 bacterium]
DGTQLVNKVTANADQGSAEAQEVTTVKSASGLAIQKTGSSDPVKPGDNLTYTITYSNSSEASQTATNVVVRETYDANVTFVSANPSPDLGTNDTWTIGNLDPGDSGTITITVRIKEAVPHDTEIVNIVVISSAQGSASAQQVTRVESLPILTIQKDDFPDPVRGGGSLKYTISYANEGSAMATNVVVRETYDANVTFASADPSPDAGTNDTWTIGDLAAGASGTISVVVEVRTLMPNGTKLVNGVVIEGDGVSASAQEVTTISSGAIPTVNEWGMIIFMILFSIVALYYMRKMRRVQ